MTADHRQAIESVRKEAIVPATGDISTIAFCSAT
jgi:hypothetical protein